MHKVYLGIGGNIGNRKKNMNNAIKLIDKKIGKVEKCSSWYMSEPWGFDHAKYFVNAVILVHSNLSVENILEKCFIIEQELHRYRKRNQYVTKSTERNYEGRTIDIDILFYDYKIINTKKLKVPHPLLAERKFVLLPLAEIAPDLQHPVLQKNISNLIKECRDKSRIKKL